jgi:hypothetical protein
MPSNLSETENHIPCVEIYDIISGSYKVCADLHCCNFSRMTHELQGLESHEPLDSVKGGKFIE